MNDARERHRRSMQSTQKEWRACAGKIKHPSRKVAAAHARKLAMRAYPCAMCGAWHIGHSRRAS